MAILKKMLRNIEEVDKEILIHHIEMCDKKTITLWALDAAKTNILPLWTKYYKDDVRPRRALEASNCWLNQEIKLFEAKKEILECHKAARESNDNPVAVAAARAIGQAASMIHTPKHCIGFVSYGSFAIAYEKIGKDAIWEDVEKQAKLECSKMIKTLVQFSKKAEKKISK